MKIAIISARYLEQHAIEAFFGEIFGYGQARVTVSILTIVIEVKQALIIKFARGRFQCALPRGLSDVRQTGTATISSLYTKWELGRAGDDEGIGRFHTLSQLMKGSSEEKKKKHSEYILVCWHGTVLSHAIKRCSVSCT